MNRALTITIGDLSRSLQKAISSTDLDKKVQETANRRGREIIEANNVNHPELRASVSRTGPFSWKIDFTAPNLWRTTYGTTIHSGGEFITRPRGPR